MNSQEPLFRVAKPPPHLVKLITGFNNENADRTCLNISKKHF